MSGSDGDDDIEEVEVEHGIRRTRRLTNFIRRESSALDPSQMMEAEVHYNFAENAALDSLHILEMVSLLLALHQRFSNMMASWQQIQGIGIEVLKSLKEKIQQLRKSMDHLLLFFRWVSCYGEMAMLYAEDLTVFIRPRTPRFQPKRYRHLSEINRADYDAWYGLTPHAFWRLFVLHYTLRRVNTVLTTTLRR